MSSKRPYRILLIDDQESIHQDYRKILEVQESTLALNKAAAQLFDDNPAVVLDWEGFELDSAMQGQEGFELVQRSIEEGNPYALAFVDVRMPPGWDGVQTIRKIWEVDPEILIVICSAYSDYSWEETVRQLGRNDRYLILKKPFDNIEVRQCAMAMTERWSVSRTDVLTGLLNRRAFLGHLKLEWSRSSRHGFPLACAMVDLDYFKRVNDTLGHQAGDQVLKAVAEVLGANCRASDYVCRYGGEEFCVLLPHTSEQGALAWAEIARQAIESTNCFAGDQVLRATASFGIAQRLEGSDSIEQLMGRADQALLVAKKLGRNCIIGYSGTNESNVALEDVQNHNLFQGLTARQVMTAPVACLNLDATAGEAAEFFLQFRINSAPVVDEDGVLAGILSEKDVIGILSNHDAWDKSIHQIMQRNVICYEDTAPVQSICEFLSRVAVRRVVIVRDGRPIGVVSRGSLLRWYSNWVNTHRREPEGRELSATRGVIRDRLVQGAQALARCASELSDNVSGPVDDLVPPVIEGVSRLQELINDLLGCSHASSTVELSPEENVFTMGDI